MRAAPIATPPLTGRSDSHAVEDVIRTHFKLKSKVIKVQLDKWLAEDDGRASAFDCSLVVSPT